MQIKLGYDVNEARRRADSTARIKSALDNVSSPVMMADNDAKIIYLNETAGALFREAENDIRRDLPAFDASALLGADIDLFHKSPQREHDPLQRLESTSTSELKIGGRSFKVVANPVVNDGVNFWDRQSNGLTVPQRLRSNRRWNL